MLTIGLAIFAAIYFFIWVVAILTRNSVTEHAAVKVFALLIIAMILSGCASGYVATVCESTTTTSEDNLTVTQNISCENQAERSELDLF